MTRANVKNKYSLKYLYWLMWFPESEACPYHTTPFAAPRLRVNLKRSRSCAGEVV
jgi:hypothetical protein